MSDLINGDELRILWCAATANEVAADELNATLVKVLASHIEASQRWSDDRVANQGYIWQIRQLVNKWLDAKRWDGEVDIVTRAYGQEVEAVMGQRPVIRDGRRVGLEPVD